MSTHVGSSTAEQSRHRRGARVGVAGRAWTRVAVGVAAVGWGANQFAPLLTLYRAELHISAATVQAAYGLYAAGLVPGLLLGGPLSDRHGRRRVLLPALLISALASVLLMAGATALGWLCVGRLVAGAASGAAFSSGTAWIKELSGSTHSAGPAPGAPSARTARAAGSGARRATVAMTTGFAAGPLAAGAVGQWAAAPMVVAYLPHLALVLLGMVLVWGVQDTRADRPNETRRRDKVRGDEAGGGDEVGGGDEAGLSAVARRRLWVLVIPLAPWVFGTSSIALAYLPGMVDHRLGGNSLVFHALLAAMTMVAGIVVQPLARRVDDPRGPTLVATAMSIVICGLLLAAAASATRGPLLVATAAVVLGAGYGSCLVWGLLEIQRVARAAELARMTAIFQAVAYLGFAVPYLLAVVQRVMPATAALLAASVLAALSLLHAVRQTRQGSISGKSLARKSARKPTPDSRTPESDTSGWPQGTSPNPAARRHRS